MNSAVHRICIPLREILFLQCFESKSFSKFVEQPGLKLIFPALGKVSRSVHSVRCRFSFLKNPLFPNQNWYHLLEKSKKGTVRGKYLAQEHNTLTLLSLQPRPSLQGVQCANLQAIVLAIFKHQRCKIDVKNEMNIF